MNNSWGFNITDTSYKSVKQLIHYLVNAAGRNANFLLNVGPMPNGKIQPEFIDTLKEIGKWMRVNSQTIYETKGNIIPPQKWGVITAKNKTLFVHITQLPEKEPYIFIPELKEKITSALQFGGGNKVTFKQTPEGTYIYFDEIKTDDADTIIQLTIQ